MGVEGRGAAGVEGRGVAGGEGQGVAGVGVGGRGAGLRVKRSCDDSNFLFDLLRKSPTVRY